MKKLVVFIACLLCGKFIFAQQQVNFNAAAQPPGTGNTYALVIGVANYFDPEIPQLQFANRDAEIFAEFLQSKAGGSVPKENIRLLVDSAATTGAVYDAVYWLKNVCQKNDIVYFYFSGHGDLENITMYNNGFLICYDSPPFNYVKLALSIDYLNDIANTLSLEKQANVILITDACHSGKLTEKRFKGNFLAGNQLRKIRDKEIRITSSSADQLSNEKEDWDGGRGVFSYYLVSGLKGLADKNKKGFVTVDDIKNYLDSSLANDEVLKMENIKQTPVVNGNGSFVLTKVDAEVMQSANQMITEDNMRHRELKTAFSQDNIPESAEEYFFSLLKKESLEALTDSFKLNEIPKEKIPFDLITGFKNDFISGASVNKLKELEKTLKADKELLKRFNSRLAIAFDEVGQRVITQYLRGDAAELEKRRYYNANNSGYDVYVRMFEVALKLTAPDNFYYNIIKVKLHYFTGVALRLKIPLTENPKPLIDKALAEQRKALALEEYAAYIYNEIGILYTYKKNDTEAEKYFITASRRAPSWAIPLSNLSDLYAAKGDLDKAILYADSAKQLQPGLQDIYLSYGIIYEKKDNLLQAEEAFQKSIKLNSRHFLPFERLGYVYMNTTQFAKADSMFYEAAERKKGFHFIEPYNPRLLKISGPNVIFQIQCNIDPNTISSNDLMGHFMLGYLAYRDEKPDAAEKEFKKVIALDNKNPLAYHYLGRLLTEQKRWQEGEIILKLALENHLPYKEYFKYYDSLREYREGEFFFSCADSCFRFGYYDKEEDMIMLAELYETWEHYNESEKYYRKLIAADPQKSTGYFRLISLFEKTGRFNDAEIFLIEYNIRNNYTGDGELSKFYKRVTDAFPENADWNLKAGNLQYSIAKSNPEGFSEDLKMTDPFTGEAVYKYPQRGDVKFPPPVKYRLIPYGFTPTLRVIKINFKPFTHGIAYLKKAAAQLQDENILAALNSKIADLYNWQGLPDSAIYFYEKAVELNQNDAGNRNKLIDLYAQNFRFTEAITQLDFLLNKNEINIDKQILLAKYYIHDARFNDAEKLLNATEIIDPRFNTEIIELKGRLALLKGDTKQALENYNRLYQVNRSDFNNLYNLARINAQAGNTAEAWKWLESAIEAGFNYTYVLRYDPFLKNIRTSANWKKMISSVKGIEYLSSTAAN